MKRVAKQTHRTVHGNGFKKAGLYKTASAVRVHLGRDTREIITSAMNSFTCLTTVLFDHYTGRPGADWSTNRARSRRLTGGVENVKPH